jgi:hypothetical protein
VVIEASANISRVGENSRSVPLLLEAQDSSFYSLKEGSQERHDLSCIERRQVRAPIACMADKMAFVLAVDMNQEEDVRTLYLHLD